MSGPRARKSRNYHHGDLRAALVKAALELAQSRSLDAVTLREVAQTAGVSPAAPYHHFPDKQALLNAVAQEGFDELTRQLLALRTEAIADPSARLQALGEAYVRFALDRPAHFRVMFRVRTLEESESTSSAFAILREAVAALMTARGVASHGRARTLNAWALVHGLAALALDGPLRTLPRPALEQVAREVIEVTVRGLTAQSHPP